MTTCLLFDCDGVLLSKPEIDHSIQRWVESVIGENVELSVIKEERQKLLQSAQKENLTVNNDEQRRAFYIEHNQSLLKAIGISSSPQLAEQLFLALQSAPYELYPDVHDLLSSLTDNESLTAGVLSNWTYTLQAVLHEVAIDQYFTFILSSYDLGVAKPDSKFFTEAQRRIEAFDRYVYIGDQLEMDILPALKAGIEPIFLDRTGAYTSDSVPCPRIESLSDLMDAM